MPYIASNIIAARAGSCCIIGGGTKEEEKCTSFEVRDSLAEQARADDEQEIGHDDEEDC
jgi:hypothetical protein